MSSPNKKILDLLGQLVRQIQQDIDQAEGKKQITHTFRLRTFRNAIRIIEGLDWKIRSADQLGDYEGIGKGVLRRIDEILKTGRLSELRDSAESGDEIAELERVYGIGKKRAQELHKKYGINTLKQLRKLVKDRRVELPEVILKGLRFADRIITPIPREEINQIHLYLLQMVRRIDPRLHLIICGSYRRLQDTSNDIDVIITHSRLKRRKDTEASTYLSDFIHLLQKDRFIVESFTSTSVPTKYMGLCRYGRKPIRRIDIRFIPYESYYYAILYFTGSGDFNRRMRQQAIRKGLTLNEYGLYDRTGRTFAVQSEKEIFDKLDMEYLQPNLRR